MLVVLSFFFKANPEKIGYSLNPHKMELSDCYGEKITG